MYKYYFAEENCILYKSGYEGSFEEYIVLFSTLNDVPFFTLNGAVSA